MTQNDSSFKIRHIIGIAALSLAANYLIQRLISEGKVEPKKPPGQNRQSKVRKQIIKAMDGMAWGSLKIIEPKKEGGVLEELHLMTKAIFEVERVNNLIVDLELTNMESYPCPLIAHEIKRVKEQPHLHPEALIHPGEFVMENCVFRTGQSVELEKKFMRSGMRATQFFKPSKVRADIVCLGKLTPGMNTVIRDLVLILKQNFKVPVVTGVKYSFKGYYENKLIDLQPEMVKTIHHFGGCYLGVSKSEFNINTILESLTERSVNQLYLIGGRNTLMAANQIYDQIKKKKLSITVCVIIKAINKDIPIFDTTFGTESAIEEAQKMIEQAYVSSRSSANEICLVKVNGKSSGFFAMEAARAARNVNVCLIPEFPFDMYGDKGMLRYVTERIKHKGNCIVVYSEGIYRSIRDLHQADKKEIMEEDTEEKQSNAFDFYLKDKIQCSLTKAKLIPNHVTIFNSVQNVKAVPANSLDTKLCSQLAQGSVQGMMCGYTNFVSGHLANRNAMVPIPEVLSRDSQTFLKPEDENWQRLLATTGQPSFINEEENSIEEIY